VGSSTLARAVQAGAVVAALVGPPRLCQGGRVTALVVTAPHYLVHGGRAAVGSGVLGIVERHPAVTRLDATAARHQRRGGRSCGGGGDNRSSRGQSVAAFTLPSHQLARVEVALIVDGCLMNVHHALS